MEALTSCRLGGYTMVWELYLLGVFRLKDYHSRVRATIEGEKSVWSEGDPNPGRICIYFFHLEALSHIMAEEMHLFFCFHQWVSKLPPSLQVFTIG
jgi:hypothetical protein